MEQYKYRLQPYAGPDSRFECPSCGHKGEFVRYIDAEGNYISPLVGKCNRAKCSYHLTPKQWFEEHPDEREQHEQSAASPAKPIEQKPQSFLPRSILNAIQPLRKQNALYQYLCTIFDTEQVDEVFAKYFVGTSKRWKVGDSLACVFPQVDEKNRVCQVKVMAYNPETGHRLHKEHDCEFWDEKSQAYVKASNYADRLLFIGKRILGADAVLHQCFFGQHLLKEARLIGIIESEKSALICSILMPQYTWFATGGKQGCRWTEEGKARLLQGKQVVLFPDEDGISEWERKAQTLRSFGINVTVSHLCEGKAEHSDVADLMIAETLKARSEPKAQTIGELCEILKDIKFGDGQCTINV